MSECEIGRREREEREGERRGRESRSECDVREGGIGGGDREECRRRRRGIGRERRDVFCDG